jgi:flavodoxin
VNAIVVHESHWGNTEAVARAIAEGLGPGARVLSTSEAIGSALDGVELIVAGAPLMALRLPTDKMVGGIEGKPGEPVPEVSQPTLRAWLAGLPHGKGAGAAFETKLHWSPGGVTGAIEKGLTAAGYARISDGQKFIVTGRAGPLRIGELDRAREWGSQLARIVDPRPLVPIEA